MIVGYFNYCLFEKVNAESKVSFSFGDNRDGKSTKAGCFQISSVDVHP